LLLIELGLAAGPPPSDRSDGARTGEETALNEEGMNMDPMKAEMLMEFAPVAALLGTLAIVGWIFTTWLRVRHGYPLEDSFGRKVHPTRVPESEKMLQAMAEENRALRTEMGELKNRIGVLERIATDPGARLDREIAGLSAGNMN